MVELVSELHCFHRNFPKHATGSMRQLAGRCELEGDIAAPENPGGVASSKSVEA